MREWISKKGYRFLFLVTVLILISLGFFLPAGSVFSVLVKGLAFILLFLGLYAVLFMNESWFEALARGREETVDESFLENEYPADASGWPGFSEAFRQFMKSYVTIVRNAMVGNGVAIYLFKGHSSLEFFIGEDDKGTVQSSVQISEGSLPHQVALNDVPLMESHLARGTLLDGVPGCHIRSFIGAPMRRKSDTIGVLAVGSDALESFGEDDRILISRWADLLVQVMDAYHHGLCAEMEQEVHRVYQDLEIQYKNVEDEDTAMLFFVQNLKRLFKFHRLTLSLRQGEEGVIRHVYGQVDQYDRNMRFPLSEGLNGWVMKRHTALIIPDIHEGDYIRPRYSRTESTDHELRSFLGIPLGSDKHSWGCLSLESKNINQYNEKARDILIKLAVQLENKLQVIQMKNRLNAPSENREQP